MAFLTSTVLLGAGLALSAAGTGLSVYGAVKQASAQKQVVAAQRRAEEIRQQAAQLEAVRKQREIVRQGMLARAQATTTATAQGAGASGSSVLAGARSNIAGSVNASLSGLAQGVESGQQMAGTNQSMFSGYAAAASAGSLGAIGQGLSSLGGGIIKNEGAISRVGGYLGVMKNG